jgi:nicotinamidase/pyrazinamidase
MTSIFTKIIRGEIPSYRVFEDDAVYAFLDINPIQPGHTLVVPRTEVPYLFDLPQADYETLWASVRTVAAAIERATGCERVAVMVVGYDVPHAHIHLIPTDRDTAIPFPEPVEQSEGELRATAERIAAAISPEPTRYDATTALVIVDVQNDFVDPDGSLSVGGAPEAIGAINSEIARARAAGAALVYTQDWHPAATPHFRDHGGRWPTHCVADSWGARLHPDLEVHQDALFVRKGAGGEDGYSAFTMEDVESGKRKSTGLHEQLADRGVQRVVLIGFATDYCVKESGHDALRLGYQTTVLTAAIRAVDLEPGDGEAALEGLEDAGAEVI